MIIRLLKFGLLSICLFVPLGCAAVIVPVPENEVLSGREITNENLAFIKQGVTSRNEVIQELGPPAMDFKELRATAYSWEVLGYYMPWVIGGGLSGAGGVAKIGKPYALLIAFDKDDHVSKFEIKERWPLDTLRSHAVKWIKRENLDVQEPPDEFVTLELPKTQAVLYIYRPGGFGDAPLLIQPAVSVDGQLVAELRKGGYIARLLHPGFHTVSVDPDPNPTSFLRPEQTPIRTFSFDALPAKAYYLKVRVKWGWGKLDPELTIYPPEDAVPVIKKLKPTW